MKPISNPTPAPASSPAPQRVTMGDIARAAGVHRSTVSLALRRESRIPAETRDRITKVAEQLGYTRDPLLDAFNFQRLAAHPSRRSLGIAYISDLPSRAAFDASPLHRESYNGARERAQQLGGTVDLLLIGPEQLSPARLDRVLQSRGISCVLIGAVSERTTKLPLDWSRYCVIAIDSFHVAPAFDSITLDLRRAARAAVQQCHTAGKTRVGFVSTVTEDRRLAHLPLSGYLVEGAQRTATALPPLLLDPANPAAARTSFLQWAKEHGPTDVIAGCALTVDLIRTGTLPALEQVRWHALIGSMESLVEKTAVYRQLGAQAAELLPLRRQVNQRGEPAHRTTILLRVPRPARP